MASQSPVHYWLRGSLIGAGSFGKVSLAINKESGELFAVKSVELCSDCSKAELAMEHELRMLQSLDSPSIIRCLGSDYSVENGVRMRNLFMEYMAGGSLADLMNKFGGQLDETLIRLYTRGILEGLDYLHNQGVVHCDIKGKNILIGSSGVKIADFGSAKWMASEEGAKTGKFLANTVIGTGNSLKGTPLWMAPEVIMQLEQGPACDIWSLGCTIVEMATGRPPWSKSLNLLAAFLREEGTLETLPLPDCLSEEGKDFLNKCLQRDPKLRWTSEQLLKHPFVEKKAAKIIDSSGGIIKAPSSPSSILDFPADTSDWDSTANSVPVLHLQRRVGNGSRGHGGQQTTAAACAGSSSITVRGGAAPCAGSSWITVRGGEEEQRQKPLSAFMLVELPPAAAVAATSAAAVRKSAAEVSFACLNFLQEGRSRRRRQTAAIETTPAL